MDKEQFSIPEILFTPSDICLMQKGIALSILESIKTINPDLQNYFFEIMAKQSEISQKEKAGKKNYFEGI